MLFFKKKEFLIYAAPKQYFTEWAILFTYVYTDRYVHMYNVYIYMMYKWTCVYEETERRGTVKNYMLADIYMNTTDNNN